MSLLLGIDLGTSSLKAVVFGLDGRPLGKGQATNQYSPGPPGWAEQDPRQWWNGCCRAIGAALAQSGAYPADIAGVGVCGFQHCPVFLDAAGEPTRTSIVTHDNRLGESLEDLRRTGLLGHVADLAGSRVLTGQFPPIYHHLRRYDRPSLEAARWILLAKDYLRYKLTGEIGTDICDATGTHLVAMPGQEWSQPICDLLQVPLEKLPPIAPPSRVSGLVTDRASQETGLRRGIPVVYGGGDSHCAMLGLGITDTGQAGLLLGTNSTLRACFGAFAKELKCSVWAQQHVVPGRYTLSASSMAGASVLSWFKDLSFGGPDRNDAHRGEGTAAAMAPAVDQASLFHELESLAACVAPGCDGLLFHPYLYGERSPFDNPAARGAFVGLAHWHGKGHLVRSVLEGVAYSISNCFDTLQAIAQSRGEPILAVRAADGGGLRLRLWQQIITDVLGFPLDLVHGEEAGCLGAALLAGVGVGLYDDIPSAVAQTVRVTSRTQPQPEAHSLYTAQRARFNRAYQALEAVLYQRSQAGGL